MATPKHDAHKDAATSSVEIEQMDGSNNITNTESPHVDKETDTTNEKKQDLHDNRKSPTSEQYLESKCTEEAKPHINEAAVVTKPRAGTIHSIETKDTTMQAEKPEKMTPTLMKIVNPYTRKSSTNITQSEHTAETSTTCMPQKRKTPNINIMNTATKKTRDSPKSTRMSMKVEGYAFHDDIIGVAHLKNNGEEAFNLTLRNMIHAGELEDEGFSSYVSIRDKSSGKQDLSLLGDDGYPKYLFLSINIHNYSNAEEARPAVLQQCQKLQTVSGICICISAVCLLTYMTLFRVLFQVVTNPMYNVFEYSYEPVGQQSDKTGSQLIVLSDVMRYSDAFRILTHCYGDATQRHRLERNFGPKYPSVIAKYFSDTDELPDYIARQLGFM